MKILYMITDLDFGGAETQLMRMVHYVKEYTQDDVQVVSVIKSEYQGFIQELNSMGVPFTSLDLKKNGNYFYAIKKYKKLLKNYQPDVIHTHMIHANLFARVFKNILYIVSLFKNNTSHRNIYIKQLLNNMHQSLKM